MEFGEEDGKMKKILLYSTITAFVILSTVSCLRPPLQDDTLFFAEATPDSTLAPLVDTLIREAEAWQEDGKMVGAEMLIIRGRNIILHKALGWADREDNVPMSRNTICRIRSMTKPFVGTAILLLQQQGKLDLNDRVAVYIPAFDNPNSDAITIYQLMTHTAGFEQTGFPKGSIYEYPSLAAGVNDLGREGPQHPPGAQYVYSDGGSAALAHLVSVVSGMPCETFIRQNIFDPLGLNDTYCNAPDSDNLRRRFSSTYNWQEDQFAKYWDNLDAQEIPFFRGSGGIYSTPLDYARFLYAWSNPRDTLLSPEIRKSALESTDFNNSYALQWEVYHRNDSLGIAFGHGGSDGTIAISLPEQDLLAVFFTQTRGTVAAALFEKLIFTELGYQPPPDYQEITLTGNSAEKIIGIYELDPWKGRIYRENGTWRIRFNQNQPLDIIPLAVDEFVIPDIAVTLKFLYDEYGDIYLMKFIRGEDIQEFKKIK